MLTRPIKVVQMLPELESGGVERGTLEVGKYLADHGNRSLVISGGGRLVSQLEQEGSSHVTWKNIGEKSPRCLQYILPLRKFLIEEKVDILHLRSRVPAWIGYLAWKSLPVRKRPALVCTFHGFHSINGYSAIMTKGDKVIAVSNAIKQHVKDAYHIADERIQMIYRGFDENVFKPENVSQKRIETLKTRWSIVDDTIPVIMLPGRLTRLKGHKVFIESLEKVKDHRWMGLCVGDADEKSSYHAELMEFFRQSGMEDRIRFVGHCDDVPAAMMIADIVVSASIKPEACSRIIFEAQAMGVPVVASAHGGSPESILHEKTGLLVRPGDPGSMAEAFDFLLTDRKRCKEMGVAARKWVNENFTINMMCEKTVQLYHRLIEDINDKYRKGESADSL